MIAPACTHENKAKHGKDRKGQQRWKCRSCGATITSNEQRPLGDMRIDLDRAALVLSMLLEGMSIRACERITGMKTDTICDLILTVGQNCDTFLESAVKGVNSRAVQMDEMWDFVGCKEKHKKLSHRGDECGDAWTWMAICADSKMILSHAVGKRDESTCVSFLQRLNGATVGPMQVTSDGLGLYTNNVPYELGSRISFAQLVKTYASSQEETRYSPATITGIEINKRFGNPNDDDISTSFSERLNLSVRMHVRRYTRLTNAHSKSFRHHAAMTALFVAWYNFCRRHETLHGKTPAMSSGLTNSVWSLKDLLRATVSVGQN
jgi:transposase-like protein/IS1 family transposase